MADIKFKKTGAEIKRAVKAKITALKKRLGKRNAQIEAIINDKAKIRSYIVRSAGSSGGMEYGREEFGGAVTLKGHISGEEIEEISQTCRRAYQIEQEIGRLSLFVKHLEAKAEFELSFSDLVDYGFEA